MFEREETPFTHLETMNSACQSKTLSPRRQLLEPLAQNSTIPNSSNQTNKVNQARHAMHAPKLLVQCNHLLGVRRGVIAPLSIPGFCSQVSLNPIFIYSKSRGRKKRTHLELFAHASR